MTTELDTFALSAGLFGGLALFLFGIDILTRALKQVAGDQMKALLARMTSNRFSGLTAGAVITSVVQSSSITTVLLVGFISAGLMTSAQSVAVILGANIGTTITAQMLAFEASALALPILAAGFFVSFVATRKQVREYGRIGLGIGMVFFGMTIMSETMHPLRSYAPFMVFVQTLDSVILAALIGAAFTALIQSSSATTGILIVMAGQGLISIEQAVPLALGANIGTCVTALLAVLGKSRDAVRAAMVHTLFNVIGVLIWLGFTDQLAELARWVAPGSAPRQLANVHTFFNVVNAMLFIGFTSQISRFVLWLLPDLPEEAAPEHAARHLAPKLLGVPAIALEAVRLEVVHLGGLVTEMLEDVMPAVTRGSPLDLDRLRVMDRPVDLLHREIVAYLREISLGSLPEGQTDELMALSRIANDLEHIGDLIATGLVTSARKRIEEGVVISAPTAHALAELHGAVMVALDGVMVALDAQDGSRAQVVRDTRDAFSERMDQVVRYGTERLGTEAPKRPMTYAREIEITQSLDDIYMIILRIARIEMRLFGVSEAQKEPS